MTTDDKIDSLIFCPDCDGRGYSIVEDSTEAEHVQYTMKCDLCDGKGRFTLNEEHTP